MKALAIGLLAASFLFLAAGCEDDDDNGSGTPPEPVRITISLNPDTLWFVAGDTAQCEVTVFVSRECCVPLPGAVVHASLSAPHNGWLTLANPQQGDTTDAYGEIRYHYYTSLTGTDLLTVTADTTHASAHIVAAHPYNGTQLTVSLILNPGNWVFPDMGDTAFIDVRGCVRDELGLSVPGLTLTFTAQRGHMDDHAMTDSTGCAHVLLTGTVDDFFVSDMLEEACEVTVEIGAFSDAGLVNFRRP
jgi:hypothetical protein